MYVFSENTVSCFPPTGRQCGHRHMHQLIEGSVSTNGHRIPLTRFCATYFSGFARKVARWIVQFSLPEVMIGEHEEEPPVKRIAVLRSIQTSDSSPNIPLTWIWNPQVILSLKVLNPYSQVFRDSQQRT